MNARIVFENEAGGVAVIVPAANTTFSLEEIALKDSRSGARFKVLDVSDIPDTRVFRNAWEFDFDSASDGLGMGPKIFREAKKEKKIISFDVVNSEHVVTINMEKAKEIAQNMIREQRKPELEKLDIEYMRASEAKDESKMESIAALKQVLRDLPADPRIEAAKTPEELEHLARTAVKEAAKV